MGDQVKWWQRAVFYQIYPRSFADGNGDGIGDFKGMISKLDYLETLGIDAVWLSPHFPSPYVDCGYDISDYRGVAPEYGNLAEFELFLQGLHQRGMRLILDLVLNHTSDKHPWFLESKSSVDNPKRDWYIWKKGEGQQPPNNWFSAFGGSAWERDPVSGEYYYHYFFKEQPDLNWKNPAVQNAMFNEARFWLELGVDGFRLDAVGTIFEDENYPDLDSDLNQEDLFRLSRTAKTSEEQNLVHKRFTEMFKFQVDRPEVHQIMKDLRKLINEYPDRVLVGETDDVAFYGSDDDELQLNFNFPLMRTNRMSANHVRDNQTQRLSELPFGAWPCNTLGNHDSPRMYTKFGDGEHNELQARLNLMMLLSLKGTPFLYNGEEIGMSDYQISSPQIFKDPLSTLYYNLEKKVMGSSELEAVLIGADWGRDKCRTPMQWTNEPNAGFCPAGVESWLPVNPDHQNGVNVYDQDKEPDSLLNYYRNLLKIRRKNPALSLGEYKEITTDNSNVLLFIRRSVQQEILVILNFANEEQSFILNYYDLLELRIIANTSDKKPNLLQDLFSLSSYQGLIYSLK